MRMNWIDKPVYAWYGLIEGEVRIVWSPRPDRIPSGLLSANLSGPAVTSKGS